MKDLKSYQEGKMRRIIFMYFFILLNSSQRNEENVYQLPQVNFTVTADLFFFIKNYIRKISLSLKNNILDPEDEPYSEVSNILSFTPLQISTFGSTNFWRRKRSFQT